MRDGKLVFSESLRHSSNKTFSCFFITAGSTYSRKNFTQGKPNGKFCPGIGAEICRSGYFRRSDKNCPGYCLLQEMIIGKKKAGGETQGC
jgi:hypothetical protein